MQITALLFHNYSVINWIYGSSEWSEKAEEYTVKKENDKKLEQDVRVPTFALQKLNTFLLAQFVELGNEFGLKGFSFWSLKSLT